MKGISLKVTLCVFLTLLLVGCGGGGQIEKENTERYNMLFEKGRAYLERGNAPMAIPPLRQALKLRSDSIVLLSMLGLAYDQVGRGVQALEMLEKAHLLSPNEGSVNNNLGVARMRQGLLEEASQAFSDALKDPTLRTPEEVWFNKALLFKRQGQLREMTAALKRSIKINGNYLPSRLELADFYQSMHRSDLEIEQLQHAVSIHSDNIAIVQQLANAYLVSGKMNLARPLLKKIVTLAPGTVEAQRASERLLLLE